MYLDNFTDLAGNELVNSDSYYQGASYGLYADTTSPTIELTNNNLEPGVTEYTFNLKDNSEEYRYSTYQGGLASNTFTLDDIGVFNGTILGSTIDERGNVKTIKVLSSSDGYQTIYVESDKFSDVAGNGNAEATFKTMIDTKEPNIYNIEKSPSGWTNEEVQLTVFASDEGSGITQYSFDDGQNWQDSNMYTVSENKEMTIKVKDNQENIASQIIKVDNIDKTVPAIELSKQENERESAIITINGTDSESGISKCSINGIDITLTNGTYDFIATENGNYIVTIYDKAGNSATKEIEVTNIDDTKEVDATIIYEKNGGKYTLFQNNSINLSETVYVTNVIMNKIEYAWTESEEEPTQWTNGGSTSGLTIEKEVTKIGNYYLYIKITDTNGHVTISHSNAFVVKSLQIDMDESIEVKNIDGVNYIILSKETEANELLGKITSDEYTIKIKNSDCTEDTINQIKTGDIVTAEGTEKYKLYKICIKGDINKDGTIDVKDILQLNQYRLEKIQLDDEQKIVSDVDGNNEININDIFQINKYRLGKIKNF